MVMGPILKARGGRYYHINEREGRRLTLSKSSLGEFIFEVLKAGGEIHQLWPFQPEFKRSPVYPVVAMTPEAKAAFEQKTGFLLVDPPRCSLELEILGG